MSVLCDRQRMGLARWTWTYLCGDIGGFLAQGDPSGRFRFHFDTFVPFFYFVQFGDNTSLLPWNGNEVKMINLSFRWANHLKNRTLDLRVGSIKLNIPVNRANVVAIRGRDNVLRTWTSCALLPVLPTLSTACIS